MADVTVEVGETAGAQGPADTAAGTAQAGYPWAGTWVTERLGLHLRDAETGDVDAPDAPVDATREMGGSGAQAVPDAASGIERTWTMRELLGLAIRRNQRRAHLLVSTMLGKHVPTAPSLVYTTGVSLGRRVGDVLGTQHADAVVVGYAETATGLGHSVADGLNAAVYLHSTRRPVPGVQPIGGFEEEHSHATSHLLLPEDPDLLAGPGPLVLVDDELSTGRTVRNTLRMLHARWPRSRYVVAALVDVRDEAQRGLLRDLAEELGVHITVVALGTGRLQLPSDILPRGARLVAEQEQRQTAQAVQGTQTVQGAPDSIRGAPDASGTADASGTPAMPATSRRVDVAWPAGVPVGARHGFTRAQRQLLDSELPALGVRLAAEVRAALRSSAAGERRRPARVLVLGFEELMYAPLRIGCALQDALGREAAEHGTGGDARGPDVEVRYSTTTRSPVLTVDDPGYAIRTQLSFPAHDDPADGPGPRYAYNVAPGDDPARRFDVVISVVDQTADTAALHADDGLLARLSAVTDTVLSVVLPETVPVPVPGDPGDPSVPGGRDGGAPEPTDALPGPLRGPHFSSYPPEDVGWLLTDLSDVELEAPTEEREEAIQNSGAHYAESLPVEYQPSAEYQRLFHSALTASAARIARAVGTVTELLLAERGRDVVLASLARAGTPVGVLMRRWAAFRHGLDLPHYAVSIVRGRGIDPVALRYLAGRHDPSRVVFVDGWTGKGAITRELTDAVAEQEAAGAHGFDPALAVLADPGGCVRTYGTRQDFLIPSACLNSTVSGLVSRTVLRADLLGPATFHGAKFYRDLAASDVSETFLEAVVGRFDEVAGDAERDAARMAASERAPSWVGWAAVERISAEYGIGDVNLVKPGVGETTRVLLRRVPWRVLVRRDVGADLNHVRLLAQQRGAPVEEVDELPYTCVGLIHPRYTRGAVGAAGTTARGL